MPVNMQIVKANDFIRLDAKGEVNLEESWQALAALAKQCVDLGVDYALLDVRKAQSDLKVTDVYRLAHAFEHVGFSKHHRLAVLHPYAGKRAEIFAAFASDRGWHVRAFDDFEEAIEWFNTSLPLDEPPAAT